MSIVSTYRRYVYQLTAGVDFLRSGLGYFYAGTLGIVTDSLLEGARQAFIQGLPGHPEQVEGSLNQVGADRQLFRYRGESLASWSSRVVNAWQGYEQAGTNIQVLRAVNEWGHIVFPSTWDAAQVHLVEGAWAQFSIWLGAGITSWGAANTYGNGEVYGQANLMYGIGGLTEDVNTLTKIVRKWKPERSKAQIAVVLSGFAWGEPGLTFGAGAILGGASVAVVSVQ